jgi:branched-chain amino acid aminotransferase
VSRQIPGGVYTTFRTYDGKKVLLLDKHIHRLEESAQIVDFPLVVDKLSIKSALHQTIEAFPFNESRIRVTVDLEREPGTVYIAMEPLHVPSAEDYRNGVCAVTHKLLRDRPRAKQTRFISVAESFRSHLPPKANEVLLLDERNHILEGSTSNFFAIKEGEIWTSAEKVLYGITRSLVLKSAEIEGIPVRMDTVSVEELPDLQEAFITSSSRSILPLRQIDEAIIADGNPGPITRILTRRYWQEIEKRLEEI